MGNENLSYFLEKNLGTYLFLGAGVALPFLKKLLTKKKRSLKYSQGINPEVKKFFKGPRILQVKENVPSFIEEFNFNKPKPSRNSSAIKIT